MILCCCHKMGSIAPIHRRRLIPGEFPAESRERRCSHSREILLQSCHLDATHFCQPHLQCQSRRRHDQSHLPKPPPTINKWRAIFATPGEGALISTAKFGGTNSNPIHEDIGEMKGVFIADHSGDRFNLLVGLQQQLGSFLHP